MTLVELAKQLRPIIEQAATTLNDETALQGIQIFPMWKSGIDANIGDRYQYNGVLYRCVQNHVAQDDWTPDKTPALWTVVSLDEWPEFVQPTGAQDAYSKGDKITFGGKHYVSLIDANVWSPVDYPAGWQMQEE